MFQASPGVVAGTPGGTGALYVKPACITKVAGNVLFLKVQIKPGI